MPAMRSAINLRKHDYLTDFKLGDFPEKLAGIDVFCGEVKVLGNGLGIFVIRQFLKDIVSQKFSACGFFVDIKNTPARRYFARAGFKILQLRDFAES